MDVEKLHGEGQRFWKWLRGASSIKTSQAVYPRVFRQEMLSSLQTWPSEIMEHTKPPALPKLLDISGKAGLLPC